MAGRDVMFLSLSLKHPEHTCLNTVKIGRDDITAVHIGALHGFCTEATSWCASEDPASIESCLPRRDCQQSSHKIVSMVQLFTSLYLK